jgi:hypothetical protein
MNKISHVVVAFMIGIALGFIMNSYLRHSAALASKERFTDTGIRFKFIEDDPLVKAVDCFFGWTEPC